MRAVLKNGVVMVRRTGIRVTYQNSIGKQVDREGCAHKKWAGGRRISEKDFLGSHYGSERERGTKSKALL
jgi:hypothetical protein